MSVGGVVGIIRPARHAPWTRSHLSVIGVMGYVIRRTWAFPHHILKVYFSRLSINPPDTVASHYYVYNAHHTHCWSHSWARREPCTNVRSGCEQSRPSNREDIRATRKQQVNARNVQNVAEP